MDTGIYIMAKGVKKPGLYANIHAKRKRIKALRGGSTAHERGIAAELRELHPLTDREGMTASQWNASRAGKFNTLLNGVVHDKTSEPYNKEAMKLIKTVARSGRYLAEYGRAQTVPEEQLRHNEQTKRLVEASIDAIKNPKQKRIDPPQPGNKDPPQPRKNDPPPAANPAPVEAEEADQDENQPPKTGSGMRQSRGDQWHYGQNRRYV